LALSIENSTSCMTLQARDKALIGSICARQQDGEK
jgi:hypothetical protein